MQVAQFVVEALEEARLYANLEHRPDVTEHFGRAVVPHTSFESLLDTSFLNVFNQVRGVRARCLL